MSESQKLYDLQKSNYPNRRGDVFRSVQVFQCWVCSALTNRVVMGGWPGYGVRTICPNSCECWHHVLEHRLGWLAKPHPSDYKASLETEIGVFREKYRSRIKNDLVGDLDLSQKKRGVTNTQSTRMGSFCEHGFGLGSYDEASIERAEAAQKKAARQEPDAEFESLIANEIPHVKTDARFFFYGEDLHAVLFPDDEFGPKLDGKNSKQAVANLARTNAISEQVLASPRLLARLRELQGIKVE